MTSHVYLAAALALLGRDDDARSAARDGLALNRISPSRAPRAPYLIRASPIPPHIRSFSKAFAMLGCQNADSRRGEGERSAPFACRSANGSFR
jgi:hypothetical protein